MQFLILFLRSNSHLRSIKQMMSNPFDRMREAADQLIKSALDQVAVIKPVVSFRETMDSRFESQNKLIEAVKTRLVY